MKLTKEQDKEIGWIILLCTMGGMNLFAALLGIFIKNLNVALLATAIALLLFFEVKRMVDKK